jgi:predicted permease
LDWVCSSFFFTVSLLGKKYGWSKNDWLLNLNCRAGDTSFLGFPIIEALYGQEGMKTAILVDQPGTFVVLSTLGIIIGYYVLKGEPNSIQIFKKIIFFRRYICCGLFDERI